jgi:UV excision repair protein RAD23
MARQNPSLVQPLLEELSRSNPALLQLIQANQADFMALLNGTAPSTPPAAVAAPATPAAVPAAGQPVQIQVTPAEAEAISRLESMGFPRDAVLQAFMACDKDVRPSRPQPSTAASHAPAPSVCLCSCCQENAAANLLFDGM